MDVEKESYLISIKNIKMIREYSQNNNVILLAFLIADLSPIDEKTLTYARNKLPLTLLNYLVNKSVVELHTYLVNLQKALASRSPKQINLTLYS